MLNPNNPEQIQVFFELAMSIGQSLDLKEMVKSSLMSYLQKLNCSSGAVLQLTQSDSGGFKYSKVISIPYKSDFKDEFKELLSYLPSKATESEINEITTYLPIKQEIVDGGNLYLMNLPDFGLICLKRIGTELTDDILFTLKSINNKLAQACVACVKNNDLKTAKEKAVESDRLKSAFIENISHEIRTPLNAIVGYSSLIADRQLTEKTLPHACRTIVASSNSLVSLVENLLDVSMLESGNFKLKYTLCNINQLLNELDEVFHKHQSIEQKEQLNLKINTPQSDVFFVSDVVRLNQIFDHLISNAIRFSDEGEIEVGYKTNSGNNKPGLKTYITFYVKDKGIGMNQKHTTRIFEPFHRIENTKEKMYRGTGIGLTITKRLIELMGGAICIDSEENKGSEISFTIPVVKHMDDLTEFLS